MLALRRERLPGVCSTHHRTTSRAPSHVASHVALQVAAGACSHMSRVSEISGSSVAEEARLRGLSVRMRCWAGTKGSV